MIKSLQVNSADGCEVNCFINDDCVSVNIGPLEDGKHVCELSSSDHNIHPEDLKDQIYFIYRPALVNSIKTLIMLLLTEKQFVITDLFI